MICPKGFWLGAPSDYKTRCSAEKCTAAFKQYLGQPHSVGGGYGTAAEPWLNVHCIQVLEQEPAIVRLCGVTVWCATWAKKIIGPFFYRKRPPKNPHIVSVPRPNSGQGGPWYRSSRGTSNQGLDGATPHTDRGVLNFLKTFPGKVISKKGDVQWPPRSPDLTVQDFWLWEYLEGKVYRHPVHSLGLGKIFHSFFPVYSAPF